MLKKQRRFPTFNDGVMGVYRENDAKIDFNASRNPSNPDNMEHVVTLPFKEATCREQDFEFANLRGFSLVKKVKTHYRPEVDCDCKAVIGIDVYGISHIDASKKEMYLYLASVGTQEGL